MNNDTEKKINEISIFQSDWFSKIYFLGLAKTFEKDINFPEILKTNHLIFFKSHDEIYTFVFTTEYKDLDFDKIATGQDVSFFKLNSLEDFKLLLQNEKLVKFYIPNKIEKIERQYKYGRTILGPCTIITSQEERNKEIYASYFTLVKDNVKECNIEEFRRFIENNFSLEEIINYNNRNINDIIKKDKEIER